MDHSFLHKFCFSLSLKHYASLPPRIDDLMLLLCTPHFYFIGTSFHTVACLIYYSWPTHALFLQRHQPYLSLPPVLIRSPMNVSFLTVSTSQHSFFPVSLPFLYSFLISCMQHLLTAVATIFPPAQVLWIHLPH